MKYLRAAVAAVAAGRLALGVVAVARPELPARAWLGNTLGSGVAPRLLGHALGGRDIALAAGALTALLAGNQQDVRRWVAAGALADTVDAAATLVLWRALPRNNRLAVLIAAGGAAAVGALGAAASDRT
ncbi:MAG TPA: hypothetical protein VGL80_06895 [Pseudonocardiaceae bacterium]|jgi:hypothetical protein